jgi:Tfp pilus assembly protein PilF
MRQMKYLVVASWLLAVGCGGGANGEGASDPSKMRDKSGKLKVSEEASREHANALEEFVRNDKGGDWNEAKCRSVAEKFIEASKTEESAAGKPLPSSLYNAGVTYLRCGLQDEALQQFQAATDADSGFHRGRAQMALFDYQKSGDLDATIGTLETVIRDAKFQTVEGLVGLAALQMERNSDQSNEDGTDDFERAKKNIQRALAIDDGYMPAFNQLAIYYMESAKKKSGTREQGRRRGLVVAGSKRVKVNQQQLELAALVASQAVQKNGNYAPIHNTAGLIQVQMDNFNGAVKSFAKARALDPKFFEAHMNYAAVNISFRGFAEAEKAYREAIKQRPDDYEAHLGLALALRGLIDDSNFEKQVAATQKELDECKRVDAARPEAYYNEAILTQEYKAKSGGDALKSIPTLEQASAQYEAFIGKAGGEEVFAEAVKRSKDRVTDIADTIKFVKESEEMRLQDIENEKAMKEQEAQIKAEEEANKKADEEAAKKEAADKKAGDDKKKADEAAKAGAAKAADPKAGAAPAAGAKPADAKAAPAAGAKPAEAKPAPKK